MRIISWHCAGFNIEKYNKLLRYEPIIILIQECTKSEFDMEIKKNNYFSTLSVYDRVSVV